MNGIILSDQELARFMSKISRTESGCWLWNGNRYHNGYGYFFLRGKNIRSHRISFEHFNGEALGDFHCCHHCDNPPCVNPDHLFKGTVSMNMLDSSRKGRNRQYLYKHLWTGERNGSAKLTEEQVAEIKTLLSFGERQTALALMYGVVPKTIYHIKTGVNWEHVKALAHAAKLMEGK